MMKKLSTVLKKLGVEKDFKPGDLLRSYNKKKETKKPEKKIPKIYLGE